MAKGDLTLSGKPLESLGNPCRRRDMSGAWHRTWV